MTEWLSGFMCGIIAMYYGRRWYLRAEMRRLEAFKADLEAICYEADVDMKTDIEAYEIFCGCADDIFEIEWRMSRYE